MTPTALTDWQFRPSRKLRLAYAISTTVIVFWMCATGMAAVLGVDFLVERIVSLGYPASFALLLGMAKLAEAAALVLPVPDRLREWAYAGSTFETLAAAFAYVSVGAPAGDVIVPFMILAVVQASFWSWIATRRTTVPTPTLLMPGDAGAHAFDPTHVQDRTFVKLYRTLHVTDDILQPAATLLADGRLDASEDIFVVERKGKAIGIPLHTLAYHHLAQGEIGGEPFLISFCPVCNSGVHFDPRVEGRVLRFAVGGVHRGTMIMTDEETGSFWDHMTGDCLGGHHAGHSLDIFGSHRIVLARDIWDQALAIPIAVPSLSWWQRLVARMQNGHTWRALPEGKFYPGFRESFAFDDPRRPEKELGIGIWTERGAAFYPLDTVRAEGGIVDDLSGTQVTLAWDTGRALPVVEFSEGQTGRAWVFTRWYGFAQTFPGCAIYDAAEA